MTSHIGEKFGKLTVIGVSYKKGEPTKMICECECSNITKVIYSSLHSGNTKTCGCSSLTNPAVATHYMSKTRFYKLYIGIRTRCNNKNDPIYKKYGAKGIKCLWNSFEEFRDDMYGSYQKHVEEYGEKDTTIDRIDPYGNYCKDNCRWLTRVEQMNNMTKNLYITINGVTKTAAEWVKEYNIVKYATFYYRVKMGWDPLKALTTPSLHTLKEK